MCGGTLKYIALGVGTQNYTCATPSSSAVPVAIGAKAVLSDAGAFLSANPGFVGALPPVALSADVYIHQSMAAILGLPPLGSHFFDAAGHPNFDLTAVGAQLVAKKVAAAPAPTGADPGPSGSGAVPWLYLTDAGLGTSFGVSNVYRLETAGGNPPTSCINSPASFEVPYAAEYWFYG